MAKMKVCANKEFGLTCRYNNKFYTVALTKENHQLLNLFLIGLFKGENVKISKEHEVVLAQDVKEFK